jgi:outer membrane protein
MGRRGRSLGALALALLLQAQARAESPQLSGDVGVGVSHAAAYVRGARHRNDAIPYLNLAYGRAFIRIDTLGVQLLPVGHGHLEAVVQIRNDGYKRPGAPSRSDSSPVGLGSLQITPLGAFGLQVLHDLGPSRGTLVQARYLAELSFGRVHIYPELGAEYLDHRYTGHYYGRDGEPEAASTARPARSALNPYVGAMVETEISPHWFANLYLRHRWFDSRATAGTLVNARHTTDVLASLAYRF